MAHATRLSQLFRNELTQLAEQCPLVAEVRVAGLMIGLDLSIEGGPIVHQCMEEGLLINCTQGHVLRLLPAMNLPEEQAREGLAILSRVLTRQQE